jgi:hypothetical protein
MGRSLKKGPYIEERLERRVEELNRARQKKVLKTWSRRSTILPEFVGPYPCRPQRKEVHPRVRHREHGGASVGGVRPHAVVPGAWLLRKGLHVADGKVVRRP